MEDLLPVLVPVTFVLALVAERVFPARALPKVSWWVVKSFVFFVLVGALNTVIPAVTADLVKSFARPVDLRGIGILPGALVILVVGDALGYVVHRTLHRVHFFWRWTHQMHHSAERLDVAGAVYLHPFDVAVQVGIPSLFVTLLGVTPSAAALAGFVFFLTNVFQHLNMRTPRWVGWIVLRPEQHSVHHARDVHAYNYGNFAFMDLLCGTFRNPKDFCPEQGFYEGASARVGAMLAGRDVAPR